MGKTLRVCLAALKQRPSVPECVEKLVAVLRECQKQKVDIVCTPETYLPGLRGASFDLPEPDQPAMVQALKDLRAACRATGSGSPALLSPSDTNTTVRTAPALPGSSKAA